MHGLMHTTISDGLAYIKAGSCRSFLFDIITSLIMTIILYVLIPLALSNVIMFALKIWAKQTRHYGCKGLRDQLNHFGVSNGLIHKRKSFLFDMQ